MDEVSKIERGGFVARLKNERQEKFCLEYIKSDKKQQSAINAGYSEKTAAAQASRMLNNVKFKHIPERIKELMEKYPKKNKLIADAKEVLEFFTEVLRAKTKYNKIVEGIDMKVYPDVKESMKAAELLGKKYAMFTEKIEHSGSGIEITVIRDDIKSK